MTTHEEIIKELVKNGPMMVGLMIYEDFMNYGEGIYVQTTGNIICLLYTSPSPRD